MNLDRFVHAYAVAALWSSTDDEGEPLDSGRDADDITAETMASMREDCADFIKANAADLAEYAEQMSSQQWSGEDRAGHDFWLTRCGHGAGFWDRGLGALGERLSKAAKVYGSIDLYIGDDGKVYAS